MSKKIGWACALIALVCALIFANQYLKEKEEEKVLEQIRQAQIQELSNNSSHTELPTTAEVIQVTSSNFGDIVLNSGKTVMVDFYADWCPPCRALSPIIDEVAGENQNEDLIFVKLNIDDEEKIADMYGIQYIPTLVLIKDGKEVDRSTGYIEKEELLEFVNR